MFKIQKSLQTKQLPCIKQYVLEQRLKTINKTIAKVDVSIVATFKYLPQNQNHNLCTMFILVDIKLKARTQLLPIRKTLISSKERSVYYTWVCQALFIDWILESSICGDICVLVQTISWFHYLYIAIICKKSADFRFNHLYIAIVYVIFIQMHLYRDYKFNKSIYECCPWVLN